MPSTSKAEWFVGVPGPTLRGPVSRLITVREHEMPRKIVTIKNQLGLHARPARLLVQTAEAFKSEIFFQRDGDRVNAKSILGVLTLAAERGSRITIEAKGADAREALEALAAQFDNKFGEE